MKTKNRIIKTKRPEPSLQRQIVLNPPEFHYEGMGTQFVGLDRQLGKIHRALFKAQDAMLHLTTHLQCLNALQNGKGKSCKR